MSDSKKVQESQASATVISDEDWRMEFIQTAVVDLYRQIKKQEEIYGAETGDTLRLSILASFISTFVYEVLNSFTVDQEGDPEDRYEAAHAAFSDLKLALGLAVASGVEGGVRAWSGVPLQYYCDIQPEPEALNSEPC